MSAARFLIDASGIFRVLARPLRDQWVDHLTSGVIATCPAVELEFLCSARSLADRLEKQRLYMDLFTWVPMSDNAFSRSEHVQQLLTEHGQHRSAGAVDLLIAATAEAHKLTVLSADPNFLTIAQVTGQPVRFVDQTP